MIEEMVLNTIRVWAQARKAVQPNASQLIDSNHCAEVSRACADRMAVLCEAEAALVELTGRKNLPIVLVAHLEACEDKGCPRCWLSSRGPDHDDCRVKIDRWFRTQDSLYTYGLALDT